VQLPHSGFVWHELMTTNPDQAERFYGEVVGLSVTAMGEGSGAYRMAMIDGTPVGGLVGPRPDGEPWPSGGPAPHWVASFGVEDADEAARKTRELGGDVLLAPTDVPGVGRAAVLRDPQGAVFGVFASQVPS
jgi:predicted enzyme related to lactoylglutathione lyase